jgi:hypothetical protein
LMLSRTPSGSSSRSAHRKCGTQCARPRAQHQKGDEARDRHIGPTTGRYFDEGKKPTTSAARSTSCIEAVCRRRTVYLSEQVSQHKPSIHRFLSCDRPITWPRTTITQSAGFSGPRRPVASVGLRRPVPTPAGSRHFDHGRQGDVSNAGRICSR